uniref:EamA domain-containing protein n=1 Tax=Alexandrium monilatum TaxID=311494 RepID=A0A7S4QJA8_9DINO
MAGAPVVASILVAMGAMCFSFMSLFAKLAENQGHLSPFMLLAVRSAVGLLLNSAANFAAWLRLRRTGKQEAPMSTGDALTPAVGRRHRQWGAVPSRSSVESHAGEEDGAGSGQIFGLTYSAIIWLSVRSGAGFGCVLLEYAALKVLPLKVNAMIVYSSPAFIVLWAAVLLRQRVRAAVVCLIAVSFSGLALEVRPWAMSDEGGAPLWAYIAALVAAALAGLVYVSLRALAGTSYITVMNTFLTTCLVLSVAVALPLDEYHLPGAEPKVWTYLVAVGAFAYAAEVFVTCGYQRAGEGTGQVSVLKFLSPVFSMLWGCLLLGEDIDWMDLAGAALILGSSAAIVLVQAKGKRSNSNPKVENPDMEDPEAGNPDMEDAEGENPSMETQEEQGAEKPTLGCIKSRQGSFVLPPPGKEEAAEPEDALKKAQEEAPAPEAAPKDCEGLATL